MHVFNKTWIYEILKSLPLTFSREQATLLGIQTDSHTYSHQCCVSIVLAHLRAAAVVKST
jgi:hypothetical protein